MVLVKKKALTTTDRAPKGLAIAVNEDCAPQATGQGLGVVGVVPPALYDLCIRSTTK